ncbi:MAG: type II toxin-antitoxin system VapC family toxin [Deltaproteobacteria bacterium]|jgi:predicted nucleic acid-binding protein|nr:type II toxin-antitoxin system VapC family toxin [Deltaproteobacteria bacterium]
MHLFLDSNALVKLYHAETGTENLVCLLKENAYDLILTIAEISKIEFRSAFLKRVRTKEIEFEIVKEAFSCFEDDLFMFNVVGVDEAVNSLAINLLDSIAYEKGLRTLDSIQLSTAIITNQILRIDYFVTSDKTLANVAKDYFPIFDPESAM